MKSKKLISLFLTFALIVTYCMSFGAVTASAADPATVTVSSVSAAPGDTVNVDLILSNYTGNIWSLALTVDAGSKLTLVREMVNNPDGDDPPQVDQLTVSGRQLFSTAIVDVPDSYTSSAKIMWSNSAISNFSKSNGTLITLKFKVADDANGDIPINLTFDEDDIINSNADNVPFSVVSGKITVSCQTHNWSNWSVKTPATCEAAGVEHKVCSVCKTEETRPIPKLNHNMAETPAESASCTQEGNVRYFHCSICNKNYSDAAGTTVLNDVTIHALGHNLNKIDEVPSTCAATGTKAYWKCSRCEKLFSDANGVTEITAPEVIQKKAHVMTTHTKVEPTCVEAGKKAYYTCQNCHKDYSDRTGTTEITDPTTLTISALGHNLTKTEKVDATCQKTGTEAYWKCSRCQKMFSDADARTEIQAPVVIAKKQHVVTASARKEPTCTEDGHIAYYTCENCNKVYTDEAGTTEITDLSTVTLRALGHNLVLVPEVRADCKTETNGTKAHYKCSRCQKLFSDAAGKNEITTPESIPFEHDYDEVITYKSDADKPTCQKTGTGYVHCTVCNKEKAVVVPKTDHTIVKVEEVAPDCRTEKDGTKEHYKCTVCNKLFSDAAGKNEITAPESIPFEHDYDEVITYKSDADKPTCQKTGKGYVHCTVCNKENEVVVDKIPHDLEKIEAVEADCRTETDGTEEYYKCSMCNKMFSDADGKNEIDAPVVVKWAHSWGEIEYASDDDKPTCTKPGIAHAKCTICDTESDAAEIPALGHKWGAWYVKKPAGPSVEGLEARECTVCHEEETRVIPAAEPFEKPKPSGGSGTSITPSHQGGSDSSSNNDNSNNNGNSNNNSNSTPDTADVEEPVVDETPDDVDVSDENDVYDDGSEDGYWQTYEIIEVNGETDLDNVTITFESGMIVVIDAPADKLVKVVLDGKKLPGEYYDVESGSTIVTIADKVLRSLKDGEHTIRFVYTDGKAELAFGFDGSIDSKIEPVYEETSGTKTTNGTLAENDDTNPITGVAVNVSAFAVIGLTAAAGALAFMKKKNHK